MKDERRGTSIVDLAERSNVSKQAASKLVSELVALGYLSTSKAPSDGRAILVRFTPRGRSLMQQSFELFADIERDYSRRLGGQTYGVVKRALQELAELRPSVTIEDPCVISNLKGRRISLAGSCCQRPSNTAVSAVSCFS